MKEIRSIIQQYDTLNASNTKMALATVVHVADSSYRRSGARMLIAEDGTWTGGISGGCLESDTLRKAQYTIYQNKPTTIRYDTRENDQDQIGVGLGCNGVIDVLISPLYQGGNHQIELLKSCIDTRKPSILLTVVESGDLEVPIGFVIKYNEDYIPQFTAFQDKLNSDINIVLQNRKSEWKTYEVEHKTWKIFIEFLPPSIHLMIFGKNYDTIPLAKIAKEIGWKVSILSNPTKVSMSLYQIADKVVNPQDGYPECDEFTVALLMSHDFKTDKRHLVELGKLNLPYIGILGPKKRAERIYQELTSEGISPPTKNVFAPIGLDTGATTPEEIAISMIAEIRTHFAGRKGGFLKDRPGRINE